MWYVFISFKKGWGGDQFDFKVPAKKCPRLDVSSFLQASWLNQSPLSCISCVKLRQDSNGEIAEEATLLLRGPTDLQE